MLDRRDYSIAASQSAQDNFNRVAAQLEALITQRDQDVKNAMSDYQADGVSDDYAGKEARWNSAATEVRGIITTLRTAMERNDETATQAIARARNAVASIG